MPASAAAAPSAALSLEQVVDVILSACRVNRREASRTLWAFAAERFRRSAGDVAHLDRLLGNELFRPLVSFVAAERGPLERIDDSARQLVTVESSGGEQATFLFALSRLGQGDRRRCWLLSGLEREYS